MPRQLSGCHEPLRKEETIDSRIIQITKKVDRYSRGGGGGGGGACINWPCLLSL